MEAKKGRIMIKLAGSKVRSDIFLLYKNNYIFTKIYILTRHSLQRPFSTHLYVWNYFFFCVSTKGKEHSSIWGFLIFSFFQKYWKNNVAPLVQSSGKIQVWDGNSKNQFAHFKHHRKQNTQKTKHKNRRVGLKRSPVLRSVFRAQLQPPSVNAWDDPVADRPAVLVPRWAIFPPALAGVPWAPVHQQDDEVDHVVPGQQVAETFTVEPEGIGAKHIWIFSRLLLLSCKYFWTKFLINKPEIVIYRYRLALYFDFFPSCACVCVSHHKAGTRLAPSAGPPGSWGGERAPTSLTPVDSCLLP